VAKVVADPDTSDSAFASAMAVLSLVVSATCRDSMVSMLSDEVRGLKDRVAKLQRIHSRGATDAAGVKPAADKSRSVGDDSRAAALLDRVLAHLQAHFQDPALSLPAVAAAVRCNPRYLTTRFTAVVGERMHVYLLALRVAHASQLLIGTDMRVKEVAFASGFTGTGRMATAFRRRVGVAPGDYRRIFSGP
jgi:AraC-like DNA-binding protein